MNVAILTRDLLDRSRIDAAVRAAGGRVTDLEIANVVFVDLRTVSPREITAYAEMATVVAYGPHVEADVLAAASAAGALALPRSKFFARLPELLGIEDPTEGLGG
jgi:hypothetical protein